MDSERSISHTEALLAWVNSFELVGEPKQIAELSDGRVIWDILHDIDPERFPDVTDPKKSNLENLITIHGRLQYNILDLRKSEGWPRGLDPEPNLFEFAENNSTRDAEKLLKLVFFAATITAKGNTASSETYGDAIQKLNSPIQESLQDFLENVEEGQYELDDLARESRESQLVKTIEELKQENNLLRERYNEKDNRVAELEYKEENLKSELEFMKERIDVLKSGKSEFGVSKRDLDQKTEEIAALEEELFMASEQNGKLSMRIEELTREAKDYQTVRDKLDIEKNNYVNANRNAKFAAEQKSKEIEMLQSKNQNLELEKKELKKQVMEYDVQAQKLNDAFRECKNALARSEREAREISITKNNVDLDNEELRRRVEGAEKEIHELKGRISELEGTDDDDAGSPRSRTPTTGIMTPSIHGNLQKDLEAAGFGESTLSIGEEEHSELINGVDNGPKEEPDKGLDEQQLAMQEEDKAKLLQEMLKPLEDAKEQLAQFISSQTGGGSEAIQQSLEGLTRQISELIEKDHERLAQRAQYIHQQNQQIKVLRERIGELERAAEEAEAAADADDDTVTREREIELQKQIENLTRELSLMSSSWYELQGKVQSTSNVPTSRYRYGAAGLVDAQKGWLARQRSAVAGR
ncbi:hypothetical protein BDV19DRAFT_361660 [Aspergillus venezuelensis]